MRISGETPIITITLLSGSNSAHTAAAYLGAKPGIDVNILTRKPSEWKNSISLITDQSPWKYKGTIVGSISKISDNPEDVIPMADVIMMTAPVHTHRHILERIAPYIKKGTILGSIYSQGGFDWAVHAGLKEHCDKLDGFFGLQNIPWICKIIRYGESVRILGTKNQLVLAAHPVENSKHYAMIVGLLFDMWTITVPNFLSLTLTPSNQIIHPARYYGIFKNWDGHTPIPREAIPDELYSSFDDTSAEILTLLDQELQAIKQQLERRYPHLDLSSVLPLHKRLCLQYKLNSQTDLKTIFRTNPAYKSLKVPVDKIDELSVRPALNSRLLWEDIPFGLCVLKSLAQKLHMSTPTMDQMILWHQKWMNKTFLNESNHQLNLELIHQTGAPEAYNLHTLDDIVNNI